MTLISTTHSSSIKVPFSSQMNRELARALGLKLYMAQAELSQRINTQHCAESYVPSQFHGKGGISIAPCRSMHSCFLCTPQQFAKMRAQLSSLIRLWSNDGVVITATFNLPFPLEVSLGQRYRYLKDCWAALTKDSRFQKLRTSHSLKYVRVLEDKYSKGQWFPHFHVVFFLDSDGLPELSELSLSLRSLWARKAQNLGLHATLPAVQHVGEFTDGTHLKLAQYLTKASFVGLDLDLEAIDANKDELTPFHLFQIAVGAGDFDALRAWREFELYSGGQNRFVFSSGALIDRAKLKRAKSSDRQKRVFEAP